MQSWDRFLLEFRSIYCVMECDRHGKVLSADFTVYRLGCHVEPGWGGSELELEQRFLELSTLFAEEGKGIEGEKCLEFCSRKSSFRGEPEERTEREA
jgi:hypothetical protein